MSGRPSRNNIKAGILVLIGIGLSTAILLILANAWTWFVPKSNYVVRFKVTEGAPGLKRDSEVRIGGQQVGRVTSVAFKAPEKAVEVPGGSASATPESPGATSAGDVPAGRNQARYVYVTIAVGQNMVIYRDADVFLELPLLGSVSMINIPDVGGPGRDLRQRPDAAFRPKGVLEEWEMIDGSLAPPSFLSQAGYGPEQKLQLQGMLRRGNETFETIQSVIADSRGPIQRSLGNVEAATADVAFTTGKVKEGVPDWMNQIGASLTSIQGASSQAEQRIIESRAIIAAIQSAIEDNRVKIDSIVNHVDKTTANAEDLSGKFNTELYATIKLGAEQAQKTVEQALVASQKVNGFLDTQLPGLELTLANMRLAGDQLKLALVEIRRSPWRLLYQPKRKEIAEELTYDSIRMYADAVSNLQAATKALENVSASASSTPESQKQLRELTTRMMDAFAEYEKASKAMLDQVMNQGK